MSAWVEALSAFIGAHPHWAGLLVFAVAASEAVLVAGMIIPGTAILLAVGGIIGLGHLPLVPILVWAALGAIAGDGFSYWMGHRYQDTLRRRWPFSRYPDLIGRGEAFFHRHGGKSVLLGRFVPVLKPVVPVVAGILGMPPGRFYVINVASALIWSPAHILPGVLVGASFGLLRGISPRLMGAALALLVALGILVWGAWVAVARVGPALALGYRKVYARLEGRAGYLSRWLDPDHPATPALVGALGVLLGAVVGLIGVLEDVLSGDPLVLADRAISHLALGLRNPWTDPVMVAITSLGDGVVTVPVALAVLGWLVARGARRLSAGVALALGLTGLAVWVLKVLVHTPGPDVLPAQAAALAFPSGHTAMAATLYGLVAWLVASARGARLRVTAYAGAFAWVLAIGTSRVYLGVQWPSDVLGGLLVGTVAVATTALLYGGVPRQRLRGSGLAVVVLAVLALAGGWHLSASYPERAARYLARPVPATMALDDWRAGAWRELPARRIDLGGEPEEALVLQWAGSPDQLAARLLTAGWRPPAGWTLSSAAGFARPGTALAALPVLPTLHDGREPALVRVQPGGSPEERWVLRAWRSGYRLTGSGTSRELLLASVVRERVLHPAGMFTRVRQAYGSGTAGALEALLGALRPRAERRVAGGATVLLAGAGIGVEVSGEAGRGVVPAGAAGCPSGGPPAFLVLGDQGTGDARQRRVAAAMEAVLRAGQGARFVLLLGDNFYPDGVRSSDDPQWRDKLESVYVGRCLGRLPLYALLGNHDHRGSIAAELDYARRELGSGRWRMPGRYYTLELGGGAGGPLGRLLALDTGARSGRANPLAAEQARAVEQAFAEGPGAPRWRIVAGHHPVRSVGRHGDTAALAGWLLPAMRRAGVDLYLSGHDYDLEVLSAPGEPLYVVSGGGGAALYRLRERARAGLQVHFAAAAYGFARVVLAPGALEVELYGEDGTRLYRHRIEAPDASAQDEAVVSPIVGDLQKAG